jgi:prepilin-type N-terminal cleavage/methylation domain-containing protein
MMTLRARAGFTLAEMLVALTISTLIGAALTGVFLSQSRLIDQQEKLGAARGVARSPITLLMSELRMVDAHGGVLAASPDSVTLRVPYAMGVVCGPNTNNTRARVLIMPVDSTIVATAGMSGFAMRRGYRDDQDYHYFTGGTLIAAARTTCDAAGIDSQTTAGWLSVGITADLSSFGPPPPGVPMFLYQNIRYAFGPSAAAPGQRALWRRVLATGTSDEIAAGFHEDARFRFFTGGAAVAEDSEPSDLTTIRGIQMVMDAESERRVAAGIERDRAMLRTAVFFRNRLD